MTKSLSVLASLLLLLLLSLSATPAPGKPPPAKPDPSPAGEEEPLTIEGRRGGFESSLGAREIRIRNCVLDSLTVVRCDRLLLENSIILQHANLLSRQSMTVRNCEFYGSVILDTSENPGAARFEHNVFTDPLVIRGRTNGFPFPTITGNSFIGQFQAVEVEDPSGSWLPFAALKLPLSGNYWGTSTGPSYPAQAPVPWLEPRGQFCQHWDPRESYEFVGFETAVSSIGREFRPHPDVWVQAARAGQNVLGSAIGRSTDILARPGRDLLVCFDMKGSLSRYGPRFTLVCDGHDLPPEGDEVFTVQRTYPPVTETAPNHPRTLNFIVKGDLVTGKPIDLKLRMDTRAIAGYATPGEEKVIWSATIKPRPKFARKLRIGVAAVDLKIPFWITATAVPDAVRDQLERELPAVWPLIPGIDLTIVALPALPIGRDYVRGAFQTLTGGNFLIRAMTRSATDYLEGWNASRPPERRLDRLICVVPNGALDHGIIFGARPEGAFYDLNWMYNSVVLVDEAYPQAVLHELGHTLGLYTGTEQYNFTTSDDLGNKVEPAEGFFAQGDGAVLRDAVIFNDSGFTGSAGYNLPIGIHHVPHDPKRKIYDLMGASNPVWIIPTSLDAVYRGLSALLGTITPATPNLAGSGSLSTSPAAGYRRILFTGVLRRYQNPDTLAYNYRIRPDTVRARDVSREDLEVSAGNRPTFQDIEALDAQGLPLQPRTPIVARLANPAIASIDPPWFQVLDVPASTTRLIVTDREAQGLEFLSIADDGIALQPRLDAIPPAGPITDTLMLDWGQNPPTKSIPVHYQLYYTADGSNTWVPIGGMTTDTSVTLDARELPATEDLAFRLVASDAFRSAESERTGYRVANRAPTVGLESPRTGDAATPESTWVLAARAFDLEDGVITLGEWQSSRDGLLGTNAFLPQVRLSPGEHTLTFTVQDRAGVRKSASVQVLSGAIGEADLEITENALSIAPVGEDPNRSTPSRLQTGRGNTIRVTVRNRGLTNEARISLYLKLEDAAEQLLASDRVSDWQPFGTRVLETVYVAPGASRYTLRAAVDDAVLFDPNPANDSRSWAFSNQPPVAFPARFDLTPTFPLDLQLSGFDPDGDPLTFRIVTGPALGVLEHPGDAWRYRPFNAGQDAFTFTAHDGRSESEPAAVTLFTATTAQPVPVPPSIVSADRIFAKMDRDFTHAVTVTAPPASFSAFNLPAGLEIDPATGRISGRPRQPGEFVVTVEARKAGATSTQDIRLRVEESLDLWLAGFGLTGADAAPGADPEGDGLNNLQEYAYRLNPTAVEPSGTPVASFVREAFGLTGERTHFVVTFRQRKGGNGNPAVDYAVDGVRYQLEYTDDLGDARSWYAGPDLFQVVESRRVDNGDGTEWITARCAIPVSGTSHGYVRLKVSPR